MAHTLDISKLGEIFDTLEANAEKLDPWQCDRLEEWSAKYKASKGRWVPSEGQLEKIEEMWLRV